MFSRTLNIKNAADLNELIEYVNVDSSILKPLLVSTSDFKIGMQSLCKLLPVPKIEMFMLDDVNINIGTSTLKLLLDQAVRLGLDLKELSSCKGFSDFSKKFGNPPQIQSTIAEARAAVFFVNQLGHSNLEFIPEIAGKKTPDFSVLIKKKQFFCECKRENPTSHDEKIKFEEWTNLIIKKTSNLSFPIDHRLEVELTDNFKRDKDKAVDDLVISIKMSLASGLFRGKTAEFSYCFIDKKQWPRANSFPPLDKGHAKVRNPVKFYPNHSWSEDVDYYLYTFNTRKPKNISTLINTAEKQIPKNKMGIIIIETSDISSATTAIKRVAPDKKYDHIKGYWFRSRSNIFYAKKMDFHLFSSLNIKICEL